MRALCVQLDLVWEDTQANFEKLSALIGRDDVPAGALVVLPETFATGFSMRRGLSERPGGATEVFLADLARRHSSYFVAGTLTKGSGGRSRNEALAFSPSGELVARYAKMHLFSPAGERDVSEPGDEIVTFDWNGFVVAPFICYDLRFPEVFREAARRGANLYVVIANWPEARHDHWTTLLTARAIENQAYVVAVNRCGSDPNNTYAGGSAIIGPRGESIGDAGRHECVISAEPDLPALQAYRSEFPALGDARAGR